MNNKIKTLLGILAFVILIGGAYFAYNTLSDKYKPSNELGLTNGNKEAPQSQKEQTSQETQSSQEEQSSQETQNSQKEQSSQETNTQEQDDRIKAPDFTVLDSEGKQVKLSDLFGKPIVLNFWASWCPPCKSEMTHFNKVYADVKEDVIFMMVDLVDGQRETVDKGKEYIKGEKFTFPVYFDTNQEAAIAYQIQSIPTTFFIDKDGYIVSGSQGAIDEETLLAGIEYIK